ncbi:MULTISPECIES: hypothetical protein [Cyanophyceae]|uniref:Uncharacterized protein n=1 Tax=Leptolyngbya subtilissima DQ-A4 TaxID=2933933 RepID=A0ABV0K6A1_9CYAN|nr:hypothetical protein [Nodosilinea sp. FACHB-141]MBD2113795.1 hypothetical protein [Nodosilinea sp. FACHB-141]
MSLERNNPVARLHQILIVIGEHTAQDDRLTVPLAKSMGLSGSDDGFAQAITSFITLVGDARKTVKTSARAISPHESLVIIDDLNKFILSSNIWDLRVKSLKGWIDSKYVLSHLAMLSASVSQEHTKAVLSKEMLAQLVDRLTRIKEEIINSDLSVDLRRFLLKKINELIWDIENYSVSGLDGIKSTSDAFIGEITIRDKGGLEKDSDKRNPLFISVFSIFATLSVIAQVNATYLEPILSTIVSSIDITERYLQPKTEDFERISTVIEDALSRKESFEEAIGEVVEKIKKEKNLYLEGKQPKLLPGSSQEEE